MKHKIKMEKEVELKTLKVRAHVRYWCDATVNGVDGDDAAPEGDMGIPCREGDLWCPVIDIATGRIENWPQGTTASLHYKVCDEGVYTLVDVDGNEVGEKDGYVPDCMCPESPGYGDYIIMDIDANGVIQKWRFNPSDILGEDED